jgi:hypothetical protein
VWEFLLGPYLVFYLLFYLVFDFDFSLERSVHTAGFSALKGTCDFIRRRMESANREHKFVSLIPYSRMADFLARLLRSFAPLFSVPPWWMFFLDQPT